MLNIVKKAAKDAGIVALKYFQKDHKYHHKGEISNFSTEADLASEKAVYEIVKEHYPKHNFLSEEMGYVDNKNDYTWVTDPIDGTFSYAKGLPFWGVSIALFYQNKPVIGVVNMPVFNNLYSAEIGKGVYLNNQKISLSKENRLENSLIAMEYGYFNSRKNQNFPAQKIYREFPGIISVSNCTVYDLAIVVQGLADGFVEETPYIWDIAAGCVLIEEAGGRVTDWQDKNIAWEFNTQQTYKIIASNGLIHKQIQKFFKDL